MFGIVKPRTWESAKRIGRVLDGWAFRGQANADWPLSSSFERATMNLPIDISKKRKEDWLLSAFRRRAHHYIQAPPGNDDLLEWLALLQHYGGPTRLLDFTHSFYVAAFFAVENAEGDSAIWAIDRLQLLINLLGMLEVRVAETPDELNSRLIPMVEECIKSDRRDCCVIPAEPDRLNERMSIQQGLFLFPGNLDESFAENLNAALNIYDKGPGSMGEPVPLRTTELWKGDASSTDIVKIVLPQKYHADVLFDLAKMNITYASLFPGLDGFARSLRLHLRFHELSTPSFERNVMFRQFSDDNESN